jgi:hypothetical protein
VVELVVEKGREVVVGGMGPGPDEGDANHDAWLDLGEKGSIAKMARHRHADCITCRMLKRQ